MHDDQWLESEPLSELVNDLAQEAAKKYRIDSAEAYHIILDQFESNVSLQQAVIKSDSAQKLKRTGAFKKAASAAKRKIYYHLRSYRVDRQQLDLLIDELEQASPTTPIEKRLEIISAIVEGHASTRERLPSQDEFYGRLFEFLESPRKVIDIGCGVQPMMFPFAAQWSRQIDRYVAADKNGNDVSCINHFSRTEHHEALIGIQWEISDGWPVLMEQTSCDHYDLAFIMKVVPVVARQQRQLLSILAETPATTWLLTGSRVALAKRQSIERREKRVLEDFVALSGRTVKHEFVVEEEFAWIVEK